MLGIVLGGLFVWWSQSALESYGRDLKFDNLRGRGARKTVLLVGIMAAHALGEGAGVGVSFSGDRGWAQGLLTTLAIGALPGRPYGWCGWVGVSGWVACGWVWVAG